MTGGLREAHDEWDYETRENKFTGHEMPLSIPCQLRFTEDPDQDTERFHRALEDNGFARLDASADRHHRETGKTHYDGEVMIEEKYHRIKVLVFRGGLVRLYPHDDYVPTLDELSNLVDAIEEGFGAPLKPSPIDTFGEDSE